MNKIGRITVTAAVVLFSRNIQAQNINYGLHAGSNFAVQSEIGDIYDNNDIRTGLSIGTYGCYNVSDNLGIQIEFNYDQKGSKYDNFTNAYNYLSVPVLAKYKLYGESSNTAVLDFYGGPYAAALLSAEQQFDNAEIDDVDMVDGTKDLEFGVQYGFTYKYPIKDNYITCNLKFGIGLSAFSEVNSEPKNKFAGLSVGYEF